MRFINLTAYGRSVLITLGIMLLIDTFTMPGTQFFMSCLGGGLIGIGIAGRFPHPVKATGKPKAMPRIDTSERNW